MSKKKRFRPFAGRLSRWLMVSLLITMACVAYLVYLLSYSAITALECTRNMNVVDYTNARIENMLSIIEQGASNNLPDIEESLGSEKAMREAMVWYLQLNPEATGVGIALKENYFPKKGRWFELYARRNGDKIEIEQIGSAEHDYLKEEWFRTCIETGKSSWSDAYLDNMGARDVLTTFTQPIRDTHGNIVGVMGADVSLSELQQKMNELDIDNFVNSWLGNGESESVSDDVRENYLGHSFIIQRDGTFLVHPDMQRILKDNFFKNASQTKAQTDDELVKLIQQGSRGYLVDTNEELAQVEIDKKATYAFFASIERTGWTTVIVVPAKAIDLEGYLVGGVICLVMTIGMIVALIVCYFVVRHSTKPLKRLSAFAGEIAQGNFEAPLPVMKNHDEFQLLCDSFENMQHSLAHYVAELQQTTAARASFMSELRIAHDIQMAMLPKVFPPFPERHDIDIYGCLTPAKAVGGDLFDFYLRDDQLFFCIGDVSGKGVPASLVMAVTRSLFRNISAHISAPNKIMAGLNEALAENNDSCMFVTLFVGVLNLTDGHLVYCNAGHNAPMLIGRDVGLLPCDANLPAGVIADKVFTLQETDIDRETTIFLYTDGLNEAENASHAQFGDQRVKELAASLLQQKQHQPEPLIKAMTDAVNHFVGDAERSDDLTMLAIQLLH